MWLVFAPILQNIPPLAFVNRARVRTARCGVNVAPCASLRACSLSPGFAMPAIRGTPSRPAHYRNGRVRGLQGRCGELPCTACRLLLPVLHIWLEPLLLRQFQNQNNRISPNITLAGPPRRKPRVISNRRVQLALLTPSPVVPLQKVRRAKLPQACSRRLKVLQKRRSSRNSPGGLRQLPRLPQVGVPALLLIRQLGRVDLAALTYPDRLVARLAVLKARRYSAYRPRGRLPRPSMPSRAWRRSHHAWLGRR